MKHFLEVMEDQPLYLCILMVDLILLGFILLHLLACISPQPNLYRLPRQVVRTMTIAVAVASFCIYLETGR